MAIQISPVGRLVMGNLYAGKATRQDGTAYAYKTGQHTGQAYSQYFFGLAVPKGAETRWQDTAWGRDAYLAGKTAAPSRADTSNFAWKVEDGDSTVPNEGGRVNRDREGFAGNWILKFSGSFAPKVCNRDGSAFLLEPDAVQLGDLVQVGYNVIANNHPQKPGLFWNYQFVYFQGYDQRGRIQLGADPRSLGAGQAPMPATASDTLPPGKAVGAAPVAPVAVAPAPEFLAPPPPPSRPAVRAMLPKAEGTYEAYVANGWNDAQLIQHGYMAA